MPHASHPPTHAGGVVFRQDDGTVRYLLVTAKRQPGSWVLPKGHIEPGESAMEAAAREVFEEAGVEAAVREALGMLEFRGLRGWVRAQFFLMEFAAEGVSSEGRKRAWLSLQDACRALPYPDARRLLTDAERAVDRRSRPKSSE